MKIVFLFLILLLTFSSCKKSETAAEENSMDVKLPPKEDMAASVAYEVVNKNAPQKSEDKTIEQKIIKTGNLRFETSELETTYNQIQTAVKNYNGTIQNDTEGKDYQSVFKNITVRVPSKNFDLFLKDVSKGVAYFDNKEISSQDVTEEYIDIDARLKAKKVLETRYLELLKKANKVSEMLEIETQLSAIREEIEAKEGQLRYMQNRVSMSTVTIEFYKNIAEESGVTVSYGAKIWNAIKSGFFGISSFLLGLLEIWPFITILGIIIYFIKKRFKKKTT